MSDFFFLLPLRVNFRFFQPTRTRTRPSRISLPTMKRSSANSDDRPTCPQGIDCKESTMSHCAQYRHLAASRGSPSPPKRPNKKRTLPNAFRLTAANGIADSYNEPRTATSIDEILGCFDGNLVQSAQFNYMFDVAWLVEQYPANKRATTPILLVHGEKGVGKAELERAARAHRNVSLVQARLDTPFGTHHTKMMLLLYDRGLRVVVHTANLIARDWRHKTQGVWTSPVFPPNPNPKSSQFQNDLLAYLTAYRNPGLDEWKTLIGQHDMSACDARIVASVPGRHVGNAMNAWGHMKLRRELSKRRFEHVTTDWDVLAQFSSIGSLGPEASRWLTGEFLVSLASTSSLQPLRRPSLKLVFPSVENVRQSLEGYPAGGSLPYSSKTALKQQYLRQMVYQWKAEKTGRTRASPHIKTYARVSPDKASFAWVLLTRYIYRKIVVRSNV